MKKLQQIIKKDITESFSTAKTLLYFYQIIILNISIFSIHYD